MKKFLSLLLAVCMLCTMLSTLALADGEPVTLRFRWWGGDARN